MKKKSLHLKIMVVLGIVCAVIWLFPYIYLISSSFKPGSEVVSIPAKFFPQALSIENFTGLFDRMPAVQYIFNSFLVAVCSTLIAVILGSLSSYAIQRSGTKIAVLLTIIVLCLKMIPTSSIAVPIYELITKMGLYDTKIALIIVYAAINMPFVMWIMLGFYEGIPIDIDEAACVDGASSLKTFLYIILPICKPGLATSFVFTLFLSWNEFLLALLLTSTNAKTFTVGLSEFLSAYSMDLGPMCAGALIFSLPVMVLSIFAQKFIVQGLTAGAVK
ncbi:carbohydrate ABC transporter permease [Enterococcus asini]|uniref:carbohydrate ABC transporter permease n=1 Tax=Enterococcus asini TaxID=57732 RepID=UPI00288DE218|nr:carbohydrate ABC transporter permease [Enterococcus asini]MDT2758007.1 carbohydrate ABC transporter permease [Enterococcus asini]